MAQQRRGRKELWGLGVLFVVLIGLAVYYEQVGQEKVATNAPSASNSHKEGVRALYLLYQREGLHTETLKTPWSELGPQDGLLVFVEPPDPDRPVTSRDIEVLERWIRQGGTLLDLMAAPPAVQPLNPIDPVTGDMAAFPASEAKHVVDCSPSPSPLLRDVHRLSIASSQRLAPDRNAPYSILAQDDEGIVAAAKPLGKGHVIVIANRYGATNTGIAEEDNAILLMNIAHEATGHANHAIQFDEYHHGVGFAQPTASGQSGLWESTPIPLRLVCYHLAGFALLLLYNGNRRFGPARYVPPVTFRSSTDYVNSMARLYRRAGAADIAFEVFYTRFVRDLRRALDVQAETGSAHLVRQAQKRFGEAVQGLQGVMLQGEAVLAGQRLHEADMLHLARQIEHFRRVCHLVGV
jgi:hypothetical protein